MAEEVLLFRLPLELRWEIYRYLLCGHHNSAKSADQSWFELSTRAFILQENREGIMAESWSTAVEKEFEKRHGSLLPIINNDRPEYAILRACRQISNEASVILYDEGIFDALYYISDINKGRFPDIGDLACNLHRVRSLTIRIYDNPFDESVTSKRVPELLDFFATRATSLRTLQIWIHFCKHKHDSSNSFVDQLLENTWMKEILCSFEVRDTIRLYISTSDGVDIDRFK